MLIAYAEFLIFKSMQQKEKMIVRIVLLVYICVKVNGSKRVLRE